MGHGFFVEEAAANASDDLALLGGERADTAALGAGLLVAEVLGRLALGGVFESAGKQRLHSRHGDVFHLGKRDIGPGPLLAPVPGDDDFSPAAGEFLDAA
jgi:hypothetical protein